MEGFIGHKSVINDLIKLIKLGKMSHANLFVGEDGIGKSLIAKYCSIHILGKETNREYADIKEYKISSNRKTISVDQIRDIIEETNKKPYEGDKKVIIVHDADKMTVQAQNAFLKTIEEPPKGVVVILLCESTDRILDTILSRCQIYKLKRLTEEEIDKFIYIKYPNITEEDMRVVKAFCNGIPGRVEKFKEDSMFISIREHIMKIMIEINKAQLIDFLENENILVKYKDQWKEVLICLFSYVRDVMIYKETGNGEMIINLDKINDIKQLAGEFSFKRLNNIINIINKTRVNLESNVNGAMVYHIMLLKMKEA
jgi:DNA polymerase-3 subunit delta'